MPHLSAVRRLTVLHRPAALLPALLLAGLVACGPSTEDEEPEIEARKGSFSKATAATSQRPTRNLDPQSLRNMSELIAGVLPDVEGESPSPVWLEHAQVMEATWRTIDERMGKMRTWAGQELGDMPEPQAPLFYPFGGPDLISALQLFPEANSYLLVGLEAPGQLPLPEDFKASALAEDIARLRRPFETFAEAGYFIRSEIDKDLSGGQFDGILPILLICLVRAEQTPLALDYVHIDPETMKISPLPPDTEEAAVVRIKFAARPEAESLLQAIEAGDPLPEIQQRAVYYFAQDLSDRGLLSEEPFRRLVEHQPATNVYIKSGEYLAHTDDFSTLRKMVLKNAQTLLQDDSGLPIRFLRSDRWTMRLYGSYTGVLAAYSQWHQEDLEAAFRKPDVRPLDFTAGYNSVTGGGLILANRRADTAAPAAP
ncbi:MAG: hypothetical protein AAGM22_17380 [Acidobacteriota bacterium]